MFTNIKLAWRNLWRNKRRTLITVASIFFGVLLSTIMSSMQEGTYSSMIDNVVKFYSGYAQIHDEEYWDEKTINNTFEYSGELIKSVNGVEEVVHYTPRLESFALASSETITKGSLVMGIDPIQEDKVTTVSKWINKGEYLKPGDLGVLVGIDLANYLQLDVGDTMVLISQGYHGVSAAGKYPIRGLLKFGLPELNKQTVYMEISNCQEFYAAENRLTALVLMFKDQYALPKAMRKLDKVIGPPFSIKSWDIMQPEIVSQIEADRAGGLFMKALLYIIIGFGIFGTVMMMVSERKRELGVVIAIGMQRTKLSAILFYETILIGVIGVLTGFAGSIPLIGYMVNNPIPLTGDAAKAMEDMGIEPAMYFSWASSVFYNQVITIFVITALVAIYPVVRSQSFKLSLALRA
ncbi:ABC transporter permease [Bacteroidota bacterium]